MTQPEPSHEPEPEEIEAFFKAVEAGDFQAVTETVEKYPGAVNWESKDGFAPLHMAILEDHKCDKDRNVAFYLIDKGANPDKLQPILNGCPMIPFAISWNANDIALKLVEAGADLSYRSPPRPKLLPDYDDPGGSTFLMSAAGWGVLPLAEALLDRGCDIHERDNKGMTAIMNAAYSGKIEMMKFLMARGGEIHDKDAEGKTVLMYAAEGGKKEMVDFLTGLGATLEGRTADGKDIRDLAQKSLRKEGLPAIEDAFRRVTEEAVNAVVNGLDRPVTVSGKTLRLKARQQFLSI